MKMKNSKYKVKNFIILGSLFFIIVSQIIIVNSTLSPDTTIKIYFPSDKDENIKLAEDIIISEITKINEMNFEILTNLNDIQNDDILVIIGHGLEQGLITKDGIVIWEEYYESIIVNSPKLTFILACNSPSDISNNIFGFESQIDAEAGSLLVIMKIIEETIGTYESSKFYNDRIERMIFSQNNMIHPLGHSYLLYIHGYYGSTIQFSELEEYLFEVNLEGNRRLNGDYIRSDYFSYFNHPDLPNGPSASDEEKVIFHNSHTISNFADRLYLFIRDNYPDGSQIDLVAHSLGGLIIREMLRIHEIDLIYQKFVIGRIVTLATPHEGTEYAYHTEGIWDTQIADQFAPDSLFMTQLNDFQWPDYHANVKWYAMGGVDDGFVAKLAATLYFGFCGNDCMVPIDSAKGENILEFDYTINIYFNTGSDANAHSLIVEKYGEANAISTEAFDEIVWFLQGDLDSDGDNLYDFMEKATLNTDPYNSDTDSDGMDDYWEVTYNLNASDASDALTDLDNDGLTNLEEYNLGTRPDLTSTDGDSFSDFYEINNGMNPLVYDDISPPSLTSLLTTSFTYQTVPFTKATVYSHFSVTDYSEVSSITLYYRSNSGSWYTKNVVIESDETYRITIASGAVGGTFIQWYIVATDELGYSSTSNIQSYTVPDDGGGFPE